MESQSSLSSVEVLARELGTRPREIFRHLVEAYLSSGEPVGSRTLSQRLPLTLSPASIRNVMADLERMGLLYAPHTSAGRVPTEKGLRLFVDGMLQIGDLSSRGTRGYRRETSRSGAPLEDVLGQAASLLSGSVALCRPARGHETGSAAEACRIRCHRTGPCAGHSGRGRWQRRKPTDRYSPRNTAIRLDGSLELSVRTPSGPNA